MTQANNPNKLRAIIFDFDGVILESADIKTNAFLELFKDHPEHLDAIHQHHLDNFGISRYKKFEWIYRELLNKPLSDEESQHLGEQFSAIVRDQILACPFVPGAREALKSLHGNFLLFVASGTPQVELEWIIEQRKLKSYFTEAWGSPKTKYEIIEDLTERFCLPKPSTFFVGDGKSDLNAARETGLNFIARVHSGTSCWAKEVTTRLVNLHGLHDVLLGRRPHP